MNTKPAIVVVDDFLPDPNAVRAHALTQSFEAQNEYFKGKRTKTAFRSPDLRSAFEKLLGRRIVRWDEYAFNGVYQVCTPTDPVVYHTDQQTHAATIYLTPGAPPDAGLALYRSRKYKTRRPERLEDDYLTDFFGGFYDSTKWELIDRIGNVFNRLVLWDGSLVHAAASYFGKGLEDGRLFQMFFFDAE